MSELPRSSLNREYWLDLAVAGQFTFLQSVFALETVDERWFFEDQHGGRFGEFDAEFLVQCELFGAGSRLSFGASEVSCTFRGILDSRGCFPRFLWFSWTSLRVSRSSFRW